MAITPVFQTGDRGSIPLTRSTNIYKNTSGHSRGVFVSVCFSSMRL